MGVRRNNEPGIFPICRKEQDLNHVLRSEGIKMWRNEILDKWFRNIKVEISITRMIKYKEKCNRLVRKNESKAETNLDKNW
jgi:hypothetical protein